MTYATVIDAPNPELKLKPGMTATVTVEVARRENVMRITNSALRFRPTPAVFATLGQPVPPELQVGRSAGAGATAAEAEPHGRASRRPASRAREARPVARRAAASGRPAEVVPAASAGAEAARRTRSAGSA